MPSQRHNLPLLIGLGLSVSIHLLIMLPVFLAALKNDPPVSYLEARFNPEDFTPPPDREEFDEEETRLGLEVDTPSTLTWVGYEEYEEHIAALARMDQAAFVDELQAALPPGMLPTANLAAEVEPTQPTTESQLPTPSKAGPPVIDPDQMIAFQKLMDALSRLFADQGEANPRRDNSETPAQKKAEKAPETKKPTEPREPAPPSAEAVPVTPTPGDQTDKESDATSVIDAKPENWKLGKPLAASGLELKTKRPVFTTLQTLTSAPRNPLYRLHFHSDGVPKVVEILESSGNTEVDAVIKASLYRWRAKGKSLATLKKDETRKVTIRIVLRGRG